MFLMDSSCGPASSGSWTAPGGPGLPSRQSRESACLPPTFLSCRPTVYVSGRAPGSRALHRAGYHSGLA